MSLGKNIKRLRLLNDMSQRELAEKLNVSDKTVCSWEIDRTEPNMGKIEKMSEIFHCTKSEIIAGTIEVPEFEDAHIELIALYSKLTKEQKQTVMSMLRSFIN